MGKGNIFGSGTKRSKTKILYESICNYTGCYNDAKSSYGFCTRHLHGRLVSKNGEWIYDE